MFVKRNTIVNKIRSLVNIDFEEMFDKMFENVSKIAKF
jgi:hypothetical protein